MRLQKLQSPLIAAFAIGVLLLASLFTLQLIHSEEQRRTQNRLQANLNSTALLLELHESDHLDRVRSIANTAMLGKLAAPLLKAGKNGTAEQLRALDDWLAPVYKSRGFDGYTVIRPDHLMVAASSTNRVGQYVQTAETKELLEYMKTHHVAMSRPTLASFPVIVDGKVVEPGVIFQLACSTISAAYGGGYLCLRLDPRKNLFPIMEASRNDQSSEAYLIDRSGRILSPSRFESEWGPKRGKGWSAMNFWARIPPIGKGGKHYPPVQGEANQLKAHPLTRIADQVIQTGKIQYMEGYTDYRGKPVAGSALWLDHGNMGLIVEEDMEEAYRSFLYVRYVVFGLTVFAGILIVLLTVHQMRNRRTLATSEQNLRAFVDNVPAGIHIKDREGRYLIMNQEFEERTGLPIGQSLGKTDFELFPLPLARKRSLEHSTVLQTQATLSAVQAHIDPLGGVRTYRIFRFPIQDPDTMEVAAVGSVGLDISELIAVQDELHKLTESLEKQVEDRTRELTVARDTAERAGQAKAEFLANMSHEIRTPLNAIVGMSFLAARLNSDPRVKRYLDRINSSSDHLLNIVNDILDFSKIEAGKLAIEQTSFSLERMLEHVAGLVWEQADAKGLELIVHIDPEVPDQLMGDSLRLGQILINFSNNAIKFTEQGEVVIRVRLVEKHVLSCRLRFEVQDTGIGIAAEKLEQLFQPFQQLDGSMSRKFGGTGLGLVISKNLAGLMDGEISVDSTLGHGSTFSLELTLERARAGRSPILPSQGLHNQSALVVDDNSNARESLVSQLNSFSMRVEQAAMGLEAIDLIAARDAADDPYHIVFIDWKMPGLSGMDTAAQIRLLSLKHPVPRLVLMSPVHDQQTGTKDVDGVVSKPLSPSLVFDAMVSLFDQKLDTRKHNPEVIDETWSVLNDREILLAEDNAINQEVARDLLEIVGAHVMIANDGMEAIQKIHMHHFDLVLMDVHMPIMNGIDATIAIRKDERFNSLPIIAMTANAMAGDRDRCMQAGMNDYIPKPINPEQMFAAMARQLTDPQAAAEVEAPVEPAATPIPADAPAVDHKLVSALRGKRHLNADIGLKHMMGRTDLYAKLIRRVLNERHNVLTETRSALERGDVEVAIRHVHGLKSISGSIGAKILEQHCSELEQSLHANALDPDNLENLAQEFKRLMQDLADASSEAERQEA